MDDTLIFLFYAMGLFDVTFACFACPAGGRNHFSHHCLSLKSKQGVLVSCLLHLQRGKETSNQICPWKSLCGYPRPPF
jgi:hypothetical protein